jgi:hypothetical protein
MFNAFLILFSQLAQWIEFPWTTSLVWRMFGIAIVSPNELKEFLGPRICHMRKKELWKAALEINSMQNERVLSIVRWAFPQYSISPSPLLFST